MHVLTKILPAAHKKSYRWASEEWTCWHCTVHQSPTWDLNHTEPSRGHLPTPSSLQAATHTCLLDYLPLPLQTDTTTQQFHFRVFSLLHTVLSQIWSLLLLLVVLPFTVLVWHCMCLNSSRPACTSYHVSMWLTDAQLSFQCWCTGPFLIVPSAWLHLHIENSMVSSWNPSLPL